MNPGAPKQNSVWLLRFKPFLSLIFLVPICLFAEQSALQKLHWRGIEIAPEYRCSEYDPNDYRYSASLEQDIIALMGGGIYGPYTGTTFASASETDIEHIIAKSEAHDSGLCAAPREMRRQFASDLLNLTLASPSVNRCSRVGKCGKDAAEWLPPRNQCWFAGRIVQVRRKYDLTIDQAEAHALETVLSNCINTSVMFFE